MLPNLLLPLLLVAGLACSGNATGPLPDGGRRVLFIGNSLTYVNDLPRTIAKPDYALEDHWNDGIAAAIAKNEWRVVVMQQGPSSTPANQEFLRIWTVQLNAAIEVGGRILNVLTATIAMPQQAAPLLTLADTTLFPEGIVRDSARGRWLISSVRQRTVVAVDDAGRITPFARDLPADVGAILGMRIDATRGALFAASAALLPMLRYTAADTLRAEVLEFDLASGALRRRIALPPAERQRAPGDIAIGADGTLYVSDGLAARLYVIPPQGDVRVITSPFIASLQGMVFTRDGRALLAADYRHGIIRIPLAGADTITQITDSTGRRLQGLDALVWHGDALIATYNGRLPGRVVRITLTPDQRGIATFTTLETLVNAGEPTLGEVHGDAFIYISNSPWSAFDERGARKPGTTLAPPEIRRLPLTP